MSETPEQIDSANGDRQPCCDLGSAMLPIAAIAGMLAVLIGAFGAHGLPDWLARYSMDDETLTRRLAQFDTGARYHLAHAIVLLVMVALPLRHGRLFSCSFALIVAGIFFFSGSLYLLVLTNTTWLGAITPIGGVCWIVGWCLLALLKVLPRTIR
ncbi:DUF423 domain-containing protein [Aporhodopirellula aestuarii]|uniref:DUF423 domain-containing protein n=1 Tax=Aporhodopirellula aestuarii TaxID=2950107 RepID=A0ABT0TYG4_9BACT|nr:DUF423 domain-containing protein [Aporhodopirellula aestuarii]MCM2369521.1 DUF423 domain-containing protein [Aporhodopirellula aestuarii]